MSSERSGLRHPGRKSAPPGYQGGLLGLDLQAPRLDPPLGRGRAYPVGAMHMRQILVAAFLVSAPLLAHGGQYVGPPIIPMGPGAPGIPGPRSGGPMTPGGGAPAPGTPSGGAEVDLTRWQFWWELNKHPYLELKKAVHGDDDSVPVGPTVARKASRPARTDLLETVAALERALETTNNRDTTTGCLMALAKIGIEAKTPLLTLFKRRLTDADLEIRETAALALGVANLPEAAHYLQSLVRDDAEVLRLVAKVEVDDRVRAFAAYGLGLLAWHDSGTTLKQQAYSTFKAVLDDKNLSSRNVKVAAIQGIRLLRLDPEASPLHKRLLWQVLQGLDQFFAADLGRSEQQIQAHVPTAVALLLGRGTSDDHERWKRILVQELTKRRDHAIAQSCALALGNLAERQEKSAADATIAKALLDQVKNAQDQQTRYFSLIGLGRIGGTAIRTELLKLLPRIRSLDRPWVAIALGVLQNQEPVADPTVSRMLHSELRNERTPEQLSAYAVACGLARAQEAAADLRALLGTYRRHDETCALLCIALALLDDKKAIPLLRELINDSIRRPEIIRGAAIAYGRLAGVEASDLLLAQLEQNDLSTIRLAGVAKALELIGERRALAPLQQILGKSTVTHLARAFSAAALGGICDKEDLPWNVKISVDINYRAAVETLTNGQSGILDIL